MNTAGLQSATKRTGGYAFWCNAAGVTYFWRKNLTSTTRVAYRVYVYCDTRPAAGTRGQLVSNLVSSPASSHGDIQIDENGVMYAAFWTSAGVLEGTESTGPTLALNTWTRLDVLVDVSANPNTIDWKVDGTAQTQASFAQAATSSTNINTGQVNTTATYSVYFDDLIVGNAVADFPFGAGHVVMILPGGDGTHSFTLGDFKYGDGGTNIAVAATDANTMVDDAVPWVTARSTTDNIYQAVVRTTGYIEIKPATGVAEAGTANGVNAYLSYSSTAAQANRGACIIRNSAGTAVEMWGDLPVAQGGNGAATDDYSMTANTFKFAIPTVPAAGWTATEIEALRWRVGGSGDVTPFPTWQALMLEVDYPDAAAADLPARPIRTIQQAVARAATI